jgi:anaerobic carbon-monoxide dehydrogenase iron sulfur subunit
MTANRPRALRVNLKTCTGCRACTIICALTHEQRLELYRARIRVDKSMPELNKPVFKPRFCRMCRNARCIVACPTGALYEDPESHLVVLDPALCDGCGHCVEACPFDAIWIDERESVALKCDLCGGDPQCVKYCSPGALLFD